MTEPSESVPDRVPVRRPSAAEGFKWFVGVVFVLGAATVTTVLTLTMGEPMRFWVAVVVHAVAYALCVGGASFYAVWRSTHDAMLKAGQAVPPTWGESPAARLGLGLMALAVLFAFGAGWALGAWAGVP
mgnify:CR=1 FL=1